MRNIMLLSLGLAVFLIGCDASTQHSNDSDFPQNGKVDKTAKPAGGPPVAGEYNIPQGYPDDAAKKGAPAPKKAGETTDKAAPKEEEKAAPKEGEKGAKNDAKLSSEEIAEINKLADPKDRELALAQKICPISGDHLGEMGAPLKVSALGKTAFLCCKGCKEDFEKDPKAALAKIGK